MNPLSTVSPSIRSRNGTIHFSTSPFEKIWRKTFVGLQQHALKNQVHCDLDKQKTKLKIQLENTKGGLQATTMSFNDNSSPNLEM